MVRIRLKRIGSRGKPFYRFVVTDQRVANSGKFIEQVGWYNPLTDPSSVNIKSERVLHWLKNGAQPSKSVAQLLRKQGLITEK